MYKKSKLLHNASIIVHEKKKKLFRLCMLEMHSRDGWHFQLQSLLLKFE